MAITAHLPSCSELKRKTQPDDPAMILLRDSHTTTPVVHDPDCFICMDPEFAQMGLPLCRPCPECQKNGRGTGHIPADDIVCSVCDYDELDSPEFEEWCNKQMASSGG